jgi:hypothetical protein
MASGMLIPRLQHGRRGRIALVIAPLLLLAIIAVAHGDEIEGGGRGERVGRGGSSDNADAERSSFSEAVSESIVIVGGGPAGASLASGLVDRSDSFLQIIITLCPRRASNMKYTPRFKLPCSFYEREMKIKKEVLILYSLEI